MTQPAPYVRHSSFTGSSPYRDATLGAAMDVEFNAVKATLDQVLYNISIIQRDDGQLANQSVGPDQLNAVFGNVSATAASALASANAAAASASASASSAAASASSASGAAAAATTAVNAALPNYALKASPTFTGTPAAPTASPGDNSTTLATTGFVAASFAPLASPAFTGTPAAPTAPLSTNTTQLATTAFVRTGVTDASSAAAGVIGEVLSSEIASGVAVSLTSTISANVTSLSLSAGDWDVWAVVIFKPAGTTTSTKFAVGVSTTSNTLPTAPNGGGYDETNVSVVAGLQTTLKMRLRVNVSVATPVFLVANTTFAVSTMGGYGGIYARRVR